MDNIDVSEHTCKNCNHTFTKQYCNGCGQRDADRITLSHLSHDVIHAVFHADKGIFPYIKRLIFAPGEMAREYIRGKRKVFNPMQFLVLSIGFVFLLMTFTNFYKNVEIFQMQNMPTNLPEMQKKMEGFDMFVKKNSNIIVFFLLPIFALFGKVLFSAYKNNYAEHLMLSVFAVSTSNVFTAVMLVICFFLGMGVMPILISTLIITIISLFLVYKQFYQIKWFQALWKSLIVYSLTMVVYTLISTVVVMFILLLN